MKAIVRYSVDPGDMEIRDVPHPKLDGSDKHAILKVAIASICGRDIEHFNSRLEPTKVPYIPGHEFSGVIAELPAGHSTDFKVGDRVVSETVESVCGECPACRKGLYNLCKHRKNIGGGMNGAFTSYIRVPLRFMHALPDTITLNQAALIEPTCVSYNVAKINSRIEEGDRVVIIGAGTIALLCLKFALLEGASVAVVGLPKDRMQLDLAGKLGADLVLTTADPIVERVLNVTDGFGAPLVIDTVGGVPQTIDDALAMVAPGGQITKVGWFMKPLGLNLDQLIRRNITLQGSFSHNYQIWEKCIALLASGRLTVEDLISKVMPLDQWPQAYDLLMQRTALKILLKPDTQG